LLYCSRDLFSVSSVDDIAFQESLDYFTFFLSQDKGDLGGVLAAGVPSLSGLPPGTSGRANSRPASSRVPFFLLPVCPTPVAVFFVPVLARRVAGRCSRRASLRRMNFFSPLLYFLSLIGSHPFLSPFSSFPLQDV